MAQPHQNDVAMTPYNAIREAPSSHVDSPSKAISAARITARNSTSTSIGLNTSVSPPKPNSTDTSTSTGASTSAICNGELSTTLNAYSDCPLAASWTPTTFSIALPAIATITRPANASEMLSEPMAGSSATTNQSETNAASTPAAASSPTASASGQRGSS